MVGRRQIRRSRHLAGILALLAAFVAIGGLPARASGEEERNGAEDDPLFEEELVELESQAAPDPWEPFNRGVLAFNNGFDRLLLEPFLRSYRFIVPEPGRRALHRAFRNLRSTAIFTNLVLQLRFGDAARTAGRFALNSTLGIAGLFDAGARGAGWEPEHADFGQTLGYYGLPSGPYLVLPILGPSSLRDTVGMGGDFVMDPLSWALGIQWWLPTGAGSAITEIEATHDDLARLRADSVEFYAALRSVFYQSRLSAIDRARERSALPCRD